MVYRYLPSILLFLCCLSASGQQYDRIPETMRHHPELGKTEPVFSRQDLAYELIHERTAHSRTFLHNNKTKTKAVSSAPLHYSDNGLWLTLDYEWHTDDDLMFHYPKQAPTVVYNKITQSVHFNTQSGKKIESGQERQCHFIDNNGNILGSLSANNKSHLEYGKQNLLQKELFPFVDMEITAGASFLKTNIILQSKEIIPASTSTVLLEEDLILPKGYRLISERASDGSITSFKILSENDDIVYQWHTPLITDNTSVSSKFSTERPHLQATYRIIPVSPQKYRIAVEVDASWLLSSERIYPVTIDPVVTVENFTVVNSCFFPSYQSSTLVIDVPQGETVLSSHFSYDFVAVSGSNAWTEDQRSYISGPGGQTPVFSGSGNSEGTQTYTVFNSEIANGVSEGTVEVTFYASRVWGGSGCDASFNFISQRYVEINYGTIEFGEGNIVVNEYSASNRSIPDNYGRTEDWIELYNTSDNFVNLSGYYLSNDPDEPLKWQITSGIIPPNSRILVYCSNRDISSGSVFHANFNLTQLRPDHIVFSDPTGTVLESIPMYVTQLNHSYGRVTDGSNQWGILTSPTPMQPNANVKSGYTSKPAFDIESGHYNGTVTVSLSGNIDDEVIRYTLDGSTPTSTSPLYTNSLQITETTVIRARCFSSDPEIVPGFIETNTYLINENHTLPIFSFAGDSDLLTLFNGNQNLEPIGNFEYFDENGQFVDENLGDFNKHGNDSWSYPQRGVDFISRDDYGYKRRLEHQFFATSPRNRFRRLMVKAAANDNYPFASGGAHIRDSYVQTLSQLSGLDLDERSSTNVVVYVNGQYWGVYDLRERVDDNNYTDFYYGQDYIFQQSDLYLQFLKTWGSTQVHFGNQPAINDWNSLVQFVQNNDMGDESLFEYVDSQLNIGSLIDYFVINSFVVSRDWLNYNTGWWRGLNPQGDAQKWRYILWDQEAGMGHYTNFTGMPDVTATAPPCQVEDLTVGSGHTQTLKKLIDQNPSVRQRYVTRYADLLNTHFSCENLITVLDSMVANIAPEMPRQIQRWGGNITTWENNVQNVRDFLETRCQSLVTSLATCYNLTGPFSCEYNVQPQGAGKIKMNSEWLSSFPFTAQMYGNIETLLTAEAAPGYVFSHWVVDGAVISPDSQAENINFQISQATDVTAYFFNPSLGDKELMYYWHFNSLVTPNDVTTISSDFNQDNLSSTQLTYIGTGERDIDAYNTGSALNLYMDETAGKAARVRNPSTNRSLIFDLPTTGYKDIEFDYTVHRSGQGMLKNIIEYSIDGGITFTQNGLTQTEFDVSESYQVFYTDFSEISGIDDNPNFKIRILFEGNTTAANGNNRFDNIALKGISLPLSIDSVTKTQLQVIPNPVNDIVTVLSNVSMDKITLYDILGQKVMGQNPDRTRQFTFDMSTLPSGVYIMQVESESALGTIKLIKRK